MANNAKIYHIMVSFTDHYNAIFIDRFSSKTKIGKDSWYFNNSLLCKPEFSLTTKTFFKIKTQNTATPKLSSKYLIDRICKIKQSLNYVK